MTEEIYSDLIIEFISENDGLLFQIVLYKEKALRGDLFLLLSLLLSGKCRDQLQNLLDTSGLLAKLPHVFDDVVWRDFQGHHRLFVQGANDEDANLNMFVKIQFLRFIYSVADSHVNRYLLLSPEDRLQLKNIYETNSEAVVFPEGLKKLIEMDKLKKLLSKKKSKRTNSPVPNIRDIDPEFVSIEERRVAAQGEINEVRNQENPAEDNLEDQNNYNPNELRELVNQNEQMELDNNELIENNNEVMDLAERFVQLENSSQDDNRVNQEPHNEIQQDRNEQVVVSIQLNIRNRAESSQNDQEKYMRDRQRYLTNLRNKFEFAQRSERDFGEDGFIPTGAEGAREARERRAAQDLIRASIEEGRVDEGVASAQDAEEEMRLFRQGEGWQQWQAVERIMEKKKRRVAKRRSVEFEQGHFRAGSVA